MSQKTSRLHKRTKSKVGRPRGLTKRDQMIMKYIWRWKIASSLSIHSAINNDCSAYSTYKTLVRLEKFGLLESRHHPTQEFHVWCLSLEGFELIKCELGELKEDGYQSENHPHDRLVQAFQLGEWSTHRFHQVKFFTEQDLRRRDRDDYPDWVPRTEQHRPDGYTRFEIDQRSWTFAYEVELSIKCSAFLLIGLLTRIFSS
jgi:predicted transcriptional regulator